MRNNHETQTSKTAKETKEEVITLRVTAEVKERIKARAKDAKKTITDYLIKTQ